MTHPVGSCPAAAACAHPWANIPHPLSYKPGHETPQHQRLRLNPLVPRALSHPISWLSELVRKAEHLQVLQLPPCPALGELCSSPRSGRARNGSCRIRDVLQDTFPAPLPGTASALSPSLQEEETTTQSHLPPSTCAGQRGIQTCGLGNAIPCLRQGWGALEGSSEQGRKPTCVIL